MSDHPLAEPLRGLRWSAATAAFQIEGARTAGGRGRSIWDDFVETAGRVRDGSRAEPGPDSYHRFPEDVALLQRLGVDRYRFSISWVRVQPTGAGVANAEGLAYYDRLVDELLAAGDKAAAELALTKATKKLDKAVSKGVIHENQAANRKSAIAKQVAAL